MTLRGHTRHGIETIFGLIALRNDRTSLAEIRERKKYHCSGYDGSWRLLQFKYAALPTASWSALSQTLFTPFPLKPQNFQSPTVNMAFTGSDIIKIIFAIFIPPLGVFLERGCNADFLINIL
jgi:Proteolipid membrane potential modulator